MDALHSTTAQDRLQLFTTAWNAAVYTADRGGSVLSSLDGFAEMEHAGWTQALAKNQRVLLIGNGGSAGIVSHHAVDLLNVVHLAATALVEPGVLTCLGNDFGYDQSFSRQIHAHCRAGDLLVAVSSSGRSANVVNACRHARELGATVISYTGFQQDNAVRELSDMACWVPCEDYGIIESLHAFIMHTVVDLWRLRHGK